MRETCTEISGMGVAGTPRSHGVALLAPALVFLACTAVAAESAPPPPVIELEPVTVEEQRIEEEAKRIETESERFQEQLERRGKPQKTEITEKRDNSGNASVKVRTRGLTYCLNAPNTARRNGLGEDFTLMSTCPPER
jgi:hypothetical protein